MSFDKYSKIDNLYRNVDILLNDVVAMEKIHGTSCRFGWIGDTFYIGSRNNVIAKFTLNELGSPYIEDYNNEFDGYGFFIWVNDNVDIANLPNNTIFYGEFFGSGVQKGVQYFSEVKKSFAVFDVKKGENYVDYDEAHRIATSNGLDFVPLVFRGKLTVDQAKELIDCDSVLAKNNGATSISEGIVIKPIKETRDQRGNRVLVKFKSEKFNEKQKAPKVPKEVSPHFVAGSEYCTPARVENAIDKLRQEVNEDLDMKHIPILMKIYHAEILIDAEDDLPEDKKDRKEFTRGAASGVVKHYKDWLFS